MWYFWEILRNHLSSVLEENIITKHNLFCLLNCAWSLNHMARQWVDLSIHTDVCIILPGTIDPISIWHYGIISSIYLSWAQIKINATNWLIKLFISGIYLFAFTVLVSVVMSFIAIPFQHYIKIETPSMAQPPSAVKAFDLQESKNSNNWYLFANFTIWILISSTLMVLRISTIG